MGQILQGIEKRVCKQDDILVGGNDWQENLKILAEVLDRLHKYKLQNLKCSATSGREINAVKKAPTPGNVSEPRSFLGMVQYYHSFLPGLPTMLAPLH